MTLSPQQINEILHQLNLQTLIFISRTAGGQFLQPSEQEALKKAGIDVKSLYSQTDDIVKLNFQLGLLSQAIGQSAKDITYDQFKKYVLSGQSIPLTDREKASIQSIKNQSVTDIRSNQQNIFKDINNVARKEGMSVRASQEQYIKDRISEGLQNRESVKQISNTLAELTGDWSRNFSKSVQYISHTALNEGRLALIQRRGEGGQIYFVVQKDACDKCKELYLKDGNEPRIFTAKQLLENGDNIGKKTSEWKATISALHVNCRCLLTEYKEGTRWNGTRFTIPKGQPYVSPIERRKVRVVFNGEEFFV
jgi:hypothetical protein